MFLGKHYETGTVSNALAAMGSPISEDLALGASGGIAFGYFVFEYQGELPHVALLTRNTFSPFERMLDNLAIRREERSTTDPSRAERNLRTALDEGHFPIVWADAFSLPYLGLSAPNGMWMMKPLLVVGYEEDDFLVVDGLTEPISISAADLSIARGKVKKDRHRMIVFHGVDMERRPEGLLRGIQTAASLMLEKPPAGSADNFGVQGMQALSKALTALKGPKAWRTKFEPGPRLVQALAGRVGQPGIWDWIETWGTETGGDRATYAAFLREAGPLADTDFTEIAEGLDESATLWTDLADRSMPDEIPEFKTLKELKRTYVSTRSERNALRPEMRALTESAGRSSKLAALADEIQRSMAETTLQIRDKEAPLFSELQSRTQSV